MLGAEVALECSPSTVVDPPPIGNGGELPSCPVVAGALDVSVSGLLALEALSVDVVLSEDLVRSNGVDRVSSDEVAFVVVSVALVVAGAEVLFSDVTSEVVLATSEVDDQLSHPLLFCSL